MLHMFTQRVLLVASVILTPWMAACGSGEEGGMGGSTTGTAAGGAPATGPTSTSTGLSTTSAATDSAVSTMPWERISAA